MCQARPLNPLAESVGYNLKQVHAVLRNTMDAQLRPLGLTVPQYACLELLSQYPGLSNAELARNAFVSRQSMNLVLRGLEERGLLERAQVATEGRALPTELTPTGSKLLQQASNAIAQVEDTMTSHLSTDEKQQLIQQLHSCINNLEHTS